MKSYSRFALAVLAACLQSACGKDDIVGPDAISPAAVVDLEAKSFGTSTVLLSWTSTGDDGHEGTATQYDLRYSTNPISESTFALLPQSHTGQPLSSESRQSTAITGLEEGTEYYFAIVLTDDNHNRSRLSNIPASTTASVDTISPGLPTNVVIHSESETSLRLEWVSSGDDSIFGQASAYDLRFAKSAITEATWAEAMSIPLPATPAPTGTPETMVLMHLTRGTHYFLGLRVRDEAGNESNPVIVSAVTLGAMPRAWLVDKLGAGDATTIQAGIDIAASGDTVLVFPGHYFENVEFRGRDITLKSRDGYASTTIDGSARLGRSVISLTRNETPKSVIDGFSIVNGFAPAGGGIFSRDAYPTIQNNYIAYNRTGATGFGAGIFCTYTSRIQDYQVVIKDNLIEYNHSDFNGGGLGTTVPCDLNNNIIRHNTMEKEGDGGGAWISVRGGSCSIEYNHFVNNNATDHGGGLYISNSEALEMITVQYNVFISNTSGGSGNDEGSTGSGGGLALLDLRSGDIKNNTFIANTGRSEAAGGGGSILMYLTSYAVTVRQNIITGSIGCGISCFGGTGTVENNLFWENDSDLCSVTPGECPPEWLEGSIFEDPQFCGPDNAQVSSGSPALTGREVIGAESGPGCP